MQIKTLNNHNIIPHIGTRPWNKIFTFQSNPYSRRNAVLFMYAKLPFPNLRHY